MLLLYCCWCRRGFSEQTNSSRIVRRRPRLVIASAEICISAVGVSTMLVDVVVHRQGMLYGTCILVHLYVTIFYYLASPAWQRPACSPPGDCRRGIRSAGVTLFHLLTIQSETDYLKMCWTDLDQIFRIGTHIWVGMISLTFFSWSLKGRCYNNRFLARIGEN